MLFPYNFNSLGGKKNRNRRHWIINPTNECNLSPSRCRFLPTFTPLKLLLRKALSVKFTTDLHRSMGFGAKVQAATVGLCWSNSACKDSAPQAFLLPWVASGACISRPSLQDSTRSLHPAPSLLWIHVLFFRACPPDLSFAIPLSVLSHVSCVLFFPELPLRELMQTTKDPPALRHSKLE